MKDIQGNVNKREQKALEEYIKENLDIDLNDVHSMSWDYDKSTYEILVDNGSGFDKYILEDDDQWEVQDRSLLLTNQYKEARVRATNPPTQDDFLSNIEEYVKEYNL